MQHKKKCPDSRLRSCLALIGCLSFLALSPKPASASLVGGGGGSSCTLAATSSNVGNPNGFGQIFDDGSTNYYGGFGSWNCGNHFLIREHVSTNIDLAFEYQSSIDPDHPPVTAHNIVIHNLTTGTSTTVTGWADRNSDLTDHVYTFNNATAGEYEISYFRAGATLPDIMGRIVLVKPITGLTITAAPICNNYSSSNYYFTIHSTPDLPTTLFSSNSWGVPTSTTDCADHCDPENFLDIDFSTSDLLVHRSWTFSSLCWASSTAVPGNRWDATTAATTDINQYWVTNSDPSDASDLASYLAGGANPGSPVINVQVSDGISTYTATAAIVVSAPPKIADVDINTICAPGSSGATAPNPHYAVSMSGGSGTLSYNWTALGHNNVTLNSTTIADPTIQYINNTSLPYLSDYNLTVTDGVGCTVTQRVYTPLITSGYDLASRDSHYDMYDEPNSQSSIMGDGNIWASQDVWNRYYDDHIIANQPPEWAPATGGGGLPNYMYVKVRNVGCIASPDVIYTTHTSEYPHVSLYWTIGGFGGSENWDEDWTTSTLPGASSGSTVPQGLSVGDVNLPIIPAGSYTIIPVAWTPPNPHDYSTTYSTGITSSPDRMDLCFLSRVVDYHNYSSAFGMTFDEDYGPISPNVLKNNNIATDNTSVIYVDHLKPKIHVLTIGNTTGLNTSVSILVGNNTAVLNWPSTSTLSHFVSIKIYLGNLFDSWQQAGGYGSYGKIDAKERSVTFDGTKMIRLDSVHIDSGKQYLVTIEASMQPNAPAEKMQDESIYFRTIANDSDSTILGNYNYDIRYLQPSKGVLTVTEISNGPTAGCDYAEMVASDCGTNNTRNVDLRGWIVDDNSGNFNLNGCSVDAGITRSHYRFANDLLWQEVPVGSVIVVYNANNNCYNLPDTLTVDTTAQRYVYWVPIGGSELAPIGKSHFERFTTMLDSSICTYVTDTATDSTTDTSYYKVASDWQNTIAFSIYGDAFQVRCPRCDYNTANMPAFYHGFGYGNNTGDAAFSGITAGANDLGAAVINNTGQGYTYSFIGSTKEDLSDHLKWTSSAAAVAGFVPSSLGTVNSAYLEAVQNNSLNLPCCSNTAARQNSNRKGAGHDNGSQAAATVDLKTRSMIAAKIGLSVFPNPANTVLNFEYTQQPIATIRLLDVTGRVVVEKVVENSTSATIDVKGFTPGMYLYQFITNNKTQTGKVNIE